MNTKNTNELFNLKIQDRVGKAYYFDDISLSKLLSTIKKFAQENDGYIDFECYTNPEVELIFPRNKLGVS